MDPQEFASSPEEFLSCASAKLIELEGKFFEGNDDIDEEAFKKISEEQGDLLKEIIQIGQSEKLRQAASEQILLFLTHQFNLSGLNQKLEILSNSILFFKDNNEDTLLPGDFLIPILERCKKYLVESAEAEIGVKASIKQEFQTISENLEVLISLSSLSEDEQDIVYNLLFDLHDFFQEHYEAE